MPQQYRGWLSIRLARNTVLVALFLSLVFSLWQILSQLGSKRQEVDAEVQRIVSILRESAAKASYEIDERLATKVINGLLTYRFIRAATIVDDYGEVLAQRERPPSTSGTDWLSDRIFATQIDYLFDLTYPGHKSPVGELRLVVDGRMVARDFLHRALTTLLGGMLRDVVLAALLGLLFYYLITMPILKIAARVTAVDTSRPGRESLSPPTGHENDELGLLVGGINRLLQGYQSSLSRSREAERAVAEREARLRSIMENVTYGLVIIDPEDGAFLFHNQRAAALFDFQRDLLHEKTLFELVVPEERERLRERMLKVLDDRDGQTWVTVYTGLKADGTHIRFESASTLVTFQGRPGVQTFLRDVTQQEALEQQLRQAQKMEAVGTLASGVAHDFNNILQAISGFSQLLLKRHQPGGASYKYLSEIGDAVGRAAVLVRSLLTFSRKVQAQKEVVDLAELVPRTVEMLERTIPKMITIEMDLPSGLHPVEVDPVQLEQVIMNLGANARDAMPEGGVLTIGAHNLELVAGANPDGLDLPPGRYVELKVSDTGGGMDPDTLGHIFEPFFTTKGVGKGTGLGLSTVYGIVKAHGGQVVCHSQPGQGATFRVLLPEAAMAGRALSRPIRRLEQAPSGHETIMVVDDERTVLEISREALALSGYQVITAQSGEEALAIYRDRSREISMVILDLGMPGMGGHRCLKALLELDPQVRALIASGYSADQQVERAKEEGAAGFIAKPYNLPDMLTKVRQILDHKA